MVQDHGHTVSAVGDSQRHLCARHGTDPQCHADRTGSRQERVQVYLVHRHAHRAPDLLREPVYGSAPMPRHLHDDDHRSRAFLTDRQAARRRGARRGSRLHVDHVLRQGREEAA